MKNVIKFCLGLSMLLFWTACSDDLVNTPQDSDDAKEEHVISKRNCGTEEYMNKLMSDPEKKAAYEKRIKKFRGFASSNTVESRAVCDNPVVLPIAVHYQGVPNADANCLRALAESQIGILNADYQGSNSDITNWNTNSSSFPGISNGEACLEFCIASKNHPTGYGLNDGDLAVTINTTTGDNVAAWAGYVNIFVQFDTGVLGYSPLGGAGNGDGVVIHLIISAELLHMK